MAGVVGNVEPLKAVAGLCQLRIAIAKTLKMEDAVMMMLLETKANHELQQIFSPEGLGKYFGDSVPDLIKQARKGH